MKEKIVKPNQLALDLQKEINRKLKQIDKINREIAEKREELSKVCIHDEHSRVNKYIPGSYLDVCVYITEEVCDICGEVLIHTETKGGYG